MRSISISLFRSIPYVAFSLLQVSQAWAATPLADVKLDELPKWARDSLYSGTYLNIDALMKAEGISRFEAVETQNQMRDFMASGADEQTAFDTALASAKSGVAESGWKPVQFTAPGDFVAALDMDETLLQQWYKSGESGNFDLTGLIQDTAGVLKSPGYVKFTPGAEAFILGLKADSHCKGVVVFSAKADLPALDLIKNWKFKDGSPARSHLDGVFTRNHLVIGKKIYVPSKDLRIFDEKLQHVVIVDDNPGRIFQQQSLKAQPKFDADFDAKARKEHNAGAHVNYKVALQNTLAEITESAAAAERLKIPFTQSFLPYSYQGSRIYSNLSKAAKSAAKALEVTRMNPELQEAVFYADPASVPKP